MAEGLAGKYNEIEDGVVQEALICIEFCECFSCLNEVNRTQIYISLAKPT